MKRIQSIFKKRVKEYMPFKAAGEVFEERKETYKKEIDGLALKSSMWVHA